MIPAATISTVSPEPNVAKGTQIVNVIPKQKDLIFIEFFAGT
jgi:hypothetical protein